MKISRMRQPRKNITGRRIRTARLACHPALSQQALSKRLNARGIIIEQGALSRIEICDRFVLDYELKAIARCLKTSIAWLYGECGAKR